MTTPQSGGRGCAIPEFSAVETDAFTTRPLTSQDILTPGQPVLVLFPAGWPLECQCLSRWYDSTRQSGGRGCAIPEFSTVKTDAFTTRPLTSQDILTPGQPVLVLFPAGWLLECQCVKHWYDKAWGRGCAIPESSAVGTDAFTTRPLTSQDILTPGQPLLVLSPAGWPLSL